MRGCTQAALAQIDQRIEPLNDDSESRQEQPCHMHVHHHMYMCTYTEHSREQQGGKSRCQLQEMDLNGVYLTVCARAVAKGQLVLWVKYNWNGCPVCC